MSWLALITQASLLSLLRNYLLTHPAQLWWRFSGMFIILSMFVAAVVLTPDLTPDFAPAIDSNNRYARCPGPVFEARGAGFDSRTASFQSKLKLLLFVMYGYVIRILKMLPVCDNAPRRLSFWLRQKATRIEHGHNGSPAWDPYRKCRLKDRLRVMFLDPIYIAFYRLIHLHVDLITSFLAEVVLFRLIFNIQLLTCIVEGLLGNHVPCVGCQKVAHSSERLWPS